MKTPVVHREVDVVVIGAGTAGLNAAAEARKAGSSWVLVESGSCGTTCARVGCMPFYRPVLEEGLPAALRDLSKALQIMDNCRSSDFAESAGV